ncbi:MAG: serine protease [Frankiales bacterium]|nr:serine protease [Frankiales bacterium]
MRTAGRLTTAGTAVALAVATAATLGTTGAAAASPRSALTSSQPSWAQAKALRGDAADSDVVHARVYLPWRDAAGLAATAKAVSTPGSPSYGKFLSPQQFRAQYAPSQQDVSAVQKWLRDAGFSIAETPDNGHYVSVEGTVAQAEAAFGTQLGLYSAYGRTLRAAESVPSVPSELAGVVSAVVGLDDSADLIVAAARKGDEGAKETSPSQVHGAPGVGFRVGTPCSTYYGQKTVTLGDKRVEPIAPCGYTPAQVRGLYGLDDPALDTGAGQTVAFVGATASPTLVQDVTTYSRLHNLPDPSISQVVAPGVFRHPDTPRQVPGDFYGEETLDAEAIHTTAPAAKLLYVASSNANQDFDASINKIVDKHLAPIISISYGFGGEAVPRGFINSLDGTFQQAVATGIGVFVSSGDDGDDAIDFGKGNESVDFYADSPNVTAVGGTSAAIVKGAGGSVFSSGKTADAPPARSTASNGGLYGIDDPKNEVNQPGWTRQFEVGWQTELAPAKGTLTPDPSTTIDATSYAFDGTIGAGAFQAGGGGGISRVFPQPSYQQGITDKVVQPNTSPIDGTQGRAVPDISAVADPNTGFRVGQTQSFTDGTYYDEYRIGGTSLSAPLMAGMAAVANQRAGKDLGFLNPRIYAAYSTAKPTLYDVDATTVKDAKGETPKVFRVNFVDSESGANGRTYSLRTLESPNQSLRSGPGYDTATGVGTPASDQFLQTLGTVRPAPYTPTGASK